MKYGNIENTLYLCCAHDVLNYTKEFGIPDSYILNLYFPKLFTLDKIKNIEELEKKHSNLYYENKTDLSDFFDDYNERIEIFDEIHEKKINFTENGILNIHFTIHPKTEIKLPLEIICCACASPSLAC